MTTTERRLALDDKRADDGGLKLGSGIERSKWNTGRFGFIILRINLGSEAMKLTCSVFILYTFVTN
jgi:hypothetical protein